MPALGFPMICDNRKNPVSGKCDIVLLLKLPCPKWVAWDKDGQLSLKAERIRILKFATLHTEMEIFGFSWTPPKINESLFLFEINHLLLCVTTSLNIYLPLKCSKKIRIFNKICIINNDIHKM
jgi:hypothetical protein